MLKKRNNYTLICTFVERTYTNGKSRRLLSSVETDLKFLFKGKNKTICKDEAKVNFKTGVEWKHSWI